MSNAAPSPKSWLAGVLFAALAAGIGYSLPRGETESHVSAAMKAVPASGSALDGSAKASSQNMAFTPPTDSDIPDDGFGEMVRLGQAIFTDTQANAPEFVGNDLQCANCHIDKGRMANAAPLWAAYVSYPAYRSKNGHVNSFQERLQGCFRYSMNGKAPDFNDKALVALESYAYFLAKGAPTGDTKMEGRGYPKLKAPTGFDMNKGAQVYTEKCAVCHGADGAGQKAANGAVVFPPLWGARSFNWGAGMSNLDNAAAFIKAIMPFSQGGTLSDEDAWNVAAYIDSQERPQDPRFKGSVADTRKAYHDSDMSLYGTEVNGVMLGENSFPSGTVPAGNQVSN